MRIKTLQIICCIIAFLCWTPSGSLFALPQGESVESGAATFERPDPSTTNNISTLNIFAGDACVINFNSFDIGANEAVNFIQPSVSSSVLGRVVGGAASEIAGILSANGTLFLVNQNGVRFTPSAQVNVNSLIVSALDISTNNFVNGNYIMEHTLDGVYARILNEGRITGRNIALVARGVHNAGIIVAQAGTAHLSSGDKVTVSFDQKGLVQVEINEQTSGQVFDTQGNAIKDAVANSGTIEAQGVIMNARTAAGIFENAVNQSGIVKATAIAQEGGVIRIRADRTIRVSGTLEAPVGGTTVSSNGSITVASALNSVGNTNILADKDISVNSNITTVNGDLSLFADADQNGEGTFTQAAGTLISTINYGNIIIQSSGQSMLASIASAGSLLLQKGGADATFTHHAGSTITTAGSFTIGQGVTLNAANTRYSIGKDLLNLGCFNPQSSEVELVSQEPAIIQGTITFNDFKVIVPGKKVSVTAGDTITIEGVLTLHGSYGNLLQLVSTEPGVQWKIVPLGSADIAYSQIGDCFNARGPPLAAIHSNSLGNNTNLDLGSYWTGQGMSSFWSDPDNWDSGVAPAQFDTVYFDGITGLYPNNNSFIDPDFSGAIAGLIIDGYTGTLAAGRDLTVSGDWTNNNGIFDPGHFTIIFNDASRSSLISGNNTFYNFTCITPSKQLYFEAGKITKITGILKLQGAYAQHVRLLSSEQGKQWYIDARCSRDISYTWVEDSYNLDPAKIMMAESTNRGNCHNWDPTATWTGAVSNVWLVAGNWSGLGGATPGAGDDLVFPDGASNLSNTNNMAPGMSFNSITISGSGYTLGGNAIALDTGSIAATNNAGTNTINLGISCDGALTVTVSQSGATLVISGVISGTGALTKEGAGTLTLAGTNTYGGITTVSAGTLCVQNSSALGTTGGLTSIEDGASVLIDGSGLSFAERLDTLVGSGVGGLGALRNLANNNTWAGEVTLGGSSATIASTAGTLAMTGGITGAGVALVIDGAGNVTCTAAAIATTTGTLTKNGAGVLTFGFANTYTGITTINAGTLRYGADNALASGAVTIVGATLDLNGYSDTVGAITMTAGAITTGAGTLRVTGNITTNASDTSATMSGHFDLGGATRTLTIADGTAANDMEISAIISSDSGTYGITKAGTGTLVLSGANTFTGLTTVSAGVLNIQNDTALGTVTTGTTVSSGACLQVQGGISIGNESLTLAGTGISLTGALRNISGNNSWQSNITLSAAARIGSDSGTLTFNGAIYGATYALTFVGDGNVTIVGVIGTTTGSLTKYGTGTLTLTACNTYSGATSVNEGTLVLSGSGSAINSAFTVQYGGTLTLDNADGSVDRLGDQLGLTMTGGSFVFIGSPTTSVSGLAGILTISAGFNTVTIIPGAGGSTVMTFMSLTKTAGATVLFRGTDLGATPGAGVSTLIFAAAPTLLGGGGDAGTATVSIIRGAIGDASLTGTGTDMVTYNVGNSNGLRLLNGAGFSNEYLLNSFATTNANVKLTASTTAATIAINSLIVASGGSVADAGAARLITLATGTTGTAGNIIGLSGNAGINGYYTTLAYGTAENCIITPGDLAINSFITGTGGLTKSGAGVLTLGQSNLFTGTTAIASGTLRYGVDNAIYTGAVTVFNAVYDLNDYSDYIGALTMTGGSITTGTGTLMLGGDITTNANDSTATISGNVDLGSATRTITVADGLPDDDIIISAAIASSIGPYGITKAGAGRLVLSGSSSYTGPTSISAGSLSVASLANGSSNSSIGASSNAEVCLVINGGTLLYTGGTVGIDRLFSIGTSGGTIDSSGSGALTFNNTGGIGLPGSGARTLTVTGTGDVVLACVIGDNGGATALTKTGTGTLTLSAANVHTGTTTISAGAITIQNSTALGSTTGTTTVASGAMLQIDGSDLSIAEALNTLGGTGVNSAGALRNLANNNTWTGAITLLTTTGATISSDSGTLTITGVIGSGGTTPLVKGGAGTVSLAAVNTYTGSTTINTGTLAYAVNNPLPTTALYVYGGTLDIGSHFDTVGAVTMTSGSITGTTGVLTGSSYTFESGTISAVLAGTGAMTKNTGGVVTVTSNCSYTGATTINAGTIVLSGNGAAPLSAFTINYNGTLTLDNSGTTGVDRLGDTLAITMNGGDFNFIGNPANPTYGRMGALTINSGLNTVTVTPGAGGATVLTFASLSRTAGAIVRFRGTDLGTDPAANVSTILFVTAPTLTGGSGAAGTTTVSTIRGAFGDAALDGRGSDMVTYNVGNSNGLRLLNGAGFTNEYLLNWFGTTNANVKLTESTTAVTATINSLILSPGGYIKDAGTAATLTLTTGNILSYAGNAGINGDNTTVAFGSAEACVFTRGDLTIASVITGTGGLIKSGSATLTLSAANTYTGLTTIGAGTLRYGTGDDAIYTGNVTVFNATYDLNGHSDTIGALTMTGGVITTGAGTLTLGGNVTGNANLTSAEIRGHLDLGTATRTFTLANTTGINDMVISAEVASASGAYGITKAGAGTMVLSGANTYTGTTTVSAGVLNIQNNTALGTVDNGTSVTSGAALQMQEGITVGAEALTLNGTGISTTGALRNILGDNAWQGAITLGLATTIYSDNDTLTLSGGISALTYALTINAIGNVTISGATGITGTTATLAKSGAGTLTISAPGTYQGATTVSAGALNIQNATATGTTAGGVTISNNAQLQIQGNITVGAEALSLYGTGISTTGVLRNVSGNNTWAGAITLAAASRINSDSGTLTLSGGISGTFGLTIGGISDTEISGIIATTTGTLVKDGTGTLTLSAANSFTGAVTLNSGTLAYGIADALSTNAVTINNGIFDIKTFNETNLGVLTLVAGTITGSTGELTSTSAYVIQSGTISAILSGGVGLTKSTTGTVVVTSLNKYTGVTTISAGTFSVSTLTNGGLPSNIGAATNIAANIILGNTGTLLYTGGEVTIDRLFTYSNGTTGCTINNSGTGPLTFGNTGSLAYSGASPILILRGTNDINLASVIVNAGTSTTLYKYGQGTVTLTATNTYTGATLVSQGVLNIQSAQGTGTTAGGVTVSSGAQLQLQGGITVGAEALTISGTGISGDGALRSMTGANTWQGGVTLVMASAIGGESGTSITLSGVVAGAYDLIKVGSATLTFSGTGANTVSGTIRVNAGELDFSKTAGTNAFGATGTLVIGDGIGGANADIVKLINANQIPAVTITINNSGKLDLNNVSDAIGALVITGGAVSTGSGTLSLGGDITTYADASGATISGNLALVASRTFTIADGAAADDLTISAVITGVAFGITKAGAGSLVLSGADSYSGATVINAGTVTLSGSGTALSSAFTVNMGGTLILDNSATSVASRLGDALALTMNGGEFKFIGNAAAAANETTGALTLSSGYSTITAVAGAGGQTVMTFTSISRTAGATVLFRGTNLGANEGAGNANIKLGSPTLVGGGGTAGSTTISILPYAIGDTSATGSGIGFVTNNVDGGGNNNGIRPLDLSTEYATSTNDGSTVNVRLTASASLDASRSWNSLLLDAAGVTYTIGTSGTKTLTITSGAICSSGSAANTIAGGTDYTLVASATSNEFKIFSIQNLTVSAVIADTNTPALSMGGSGTLTLSAANAYTGTTTINNSATLLYGIANALATGAVTVTGGTYNLNGYSDTIGALTMTAGSITTGAGTLTLGGDVTGNAAITSAAISGYLDLGTATRTFTIANTTGLNDMVISAVINSSSGAYGITKAGSGTLVLSGTNAYTGTTTVNAGVLNIQNAAALGTTDNGTSVASGAVLQIQGGITIGDEALTLIGTGVSTTGALRNISGNNEWQGAIAIGNGATRIYCDSGLLTLSGNVTIPNVITLTVYCTGDVTISGVVGTAATAAILTKDGAGILTLTNANIYTGATNVSAGILNIRNAAATGTTAGGVAVTSGAQLQLQGGITVGAEALTLNGTGISTTGALRNISGNNEWQGIITLGAATTITSDSGTLTMSGSISALTFGLTITGEGNTVISGASGITGTTATLTKAGEGTLTISAPGTYQGATTVSVGVLNIQNVTATGTVAGGVSVTSGAALQLQGGIAVGTEALTLNGFGIDVDGALRNISGSNSWAGAVTLGSAARINSDGDLLTISGAFSGAYALTVGGSGNTTLSGVIGTGTGTLTKDGSGTLTISGTANNTFTGNTTVVSGELDLSKTDGRNAIAGALIIGDGIGGANADIVKLLVANQIPVIAITIYNSGLLDLNGFSDAAGALTMTGGSITTGAGTLTLGGDVIGNANTTSATITGNLGLGATRTFTIYDGAAADDMAISAIISGGFGLTKAGGGTLTLSALNTYTGVTTVNAGILSFDSIADRNGTASALGAPGNALNGTIALGAGALRYTGSGHSTNRVINLTVTNGTIDASGSGTLTLTGGVTGNTFNLILTGTGNAVVSTTAIATTSGTVTKNGSGTWTFSVANSYTGATTINAGTLTYTLADAISSGNVVVNGGTYNLAGFSDTIGTLTVAGGAITTGAGVLTLGGDITGTASSTAATISGNLGLGAATRTININDNLIISAVISSTGAYGIIKNGSGILTLTGANTYTGTTAITASTGGILNIQNATALGLGTVTVTVNAGTALQMQEGITIDTTKTLSIAGTGIGNTGALRSISGGNIWQGPVTLTAATRINSDSDLFSLVGATSGAYALTLGGAGDITVSGAIGTGAGTVTKDGAGTLIVNVGNGYTGATNVNAGVLNIRNATATGTTAGGVTVAYGAALQIQGGITVGVEQLTLIGTGVAGTGTLRNISDTNVWQGAISLLNNAYIAIDSGSLNPSGVISGSGSLTKNGTGTLVLSGANTFTGNVVVNGGTLQLLTNSLTVSGTMTVSGGTFDANGLGATIAGLVTIDGGTYLAKGGTQTFNGGLVISSGEFTGAGGTVTVNGDLTLSGGVLTAPSGTFNVSGDWTNSGGTFTSGTNTVTFTGGSASIDAGGTGNGKTFNNVIINSTGTKTIASAIMINGDLTMTLGTLAGDSDVTVTGGDVTGNGTITMTDGTFTLQTGGNFGGSGGTWTFFDLTFGDGSAGATTTKAGSNTTTVTGTLSVLTNHILSAGTSTWNLTWTSYLKTIQMIASGYDHTIALTADGYVFSWGNNELGQLGDGTKINRAMPVQVLAGEQGGDYLEDIVSITTGGYHSVALTSGGLVYCWGYNEQGQLGNNTKVDTSSPVKVHGVNNEGDLSGIASIAAGGFNTAAVSTTGFVFSWGSNPDGELGNGLTTDSSVPVQVLSGEQGGGTYLHNISTVAIGGAHMIALGIDGSVYAWGYNEDGELGNGSTVSSATAVAVLSGEQGGGTYLHNISSVAAGDCHSLALAATGSVYSWGYNSDGQLGNGTTVSSSTPVRVVAGAQGGGAYLQSATAISAGSSHSMAIVGGYVYSWGQNHGPRGEALDPWGQLGDGTVVNRSSPVKVLSGDQGSEVYLHDITKIAAGGAQTVALNSTLRVFNCGNNKDGQLGNGTTVAAVSQIRVQAGSQAGPNISHTPITGGGQITGTPTINFSDLYHININIPSAILMINGFSGLTLGGTGIYSLTSDTSVLGNLVINGATLSAGTYDIDLSGNWTNNNGTFNAGSGTVTLNSATQAQLVTSGGSAFNVLTITNIHAGGVAFVDRLVTAYLNAGTGVQKLSFSAASASQPHTITASFNVSGSAGSLIELAPYLAGTWYISTPVSTLHHLKISYSYNVNSQPIVATSSTDEVPGSNTNWSITP